MLRKSVFRLAVLAAFLLVPIAAEASAVTFSGSQIDTITFFSFRVATVPFNVPSDTTVITTFTWANIDMLNVAGNVNGTIGIGPIFDQPSVLNLGGVFQFQVIGNQTGLTFTVTQPGTQNITLGGVNYSITFALSQLSISPGQTVNITATLTPSNPVPEPTTMLLLGSGLVGIAVKVRKRRKGI